DEHLQAFQPATGNNLNINFLSPYASIDGALTRYFHYNLGTRYDEVFFNNRDLLLPERSFTARQGVSSPKGTISFFWTLAKIRPYSDGRLCSLSNFRQHHPDPDANCIFSSGGGRYLFDIEPLLDRRLAA